MTEVAVLRRSRKIFMSTLHRTTASMSFRKRVNGNPCPYALIGDFDVVQARPAVDPDRHGSGEIST